jgi:hypothetical protein
VTLALVLLVVVAGAALAALPAWSHSRHWGYGPSGIALVILLATLVLLLTGGT